MKSTFCGLWLLLAASVSCMAQEPESPTSFEVNFDSLFANFSDGTIVVTVYSRYNASGAACDIDSGKVRILFPGGFGGMPDFENPQDQNFQEKYKVEFWSQGCVRMGVDDDEEGYNWAVFEYLDEKYGEGWRDEIRPDAIGL